MSDSPAVRVPSDPKEQPVLDALLSIRTELELLRQDKTTYVKSQDVIGLYNKVMEQVKILNAIRTEKRLEQNRLDTVLDDCFQLISLSFLAIGKNNDPPAVYAAVSTVKRLLEHLKEAAFFCPGDLDGIAQRLKDYRECCGRCDDTYSPELITLLDARLEICQGLLDELQGSLTNLTEKDSKVYSKLVSILRSLSAINTRKTFSGSDVDDFISQLKDIERDLEVDYKEDTTGRTYEEIYLDILSAAREKMEQCGPRPAAALIKELLYRCFLWASIIKDKQGKIDERFKETYDKLLSIRNKLDNLLLTHAWSLRETDLYSFQRQLDRVDDSRINGNFLDGAGNPADLHAQRTLLYLLRKSYALIYHLIISSEPVSEALLPIYNQLQTLRKCLYEVKKSGGVSSPRELYPYSMKLNSIDNMRVDGKFMVGDDIPDGQGNVTHLLAECFDLAYELRNDAEHAEEEQAAKSDTLHSREPTAVS